LDDQRVPERKRCALEVDDNVVVEDVLPLMDLVPVPAAVAATTPGLGRETEDLIGSLLRGRSSGAIGLEIDAEQGVDGSGQRDLTADMCRNFLQCLNKLGTKGGKLICSHAHLLHLGASASHGLISYAT